MIDFDYRGNKEASGQKETFTIPVQVGTKTISMEVTRDEVLHEISKLETLFQKPTVVVSDQKTHYKMGDAFLCGMHWKNKGYQLQPQQSQTVTCTKCLKAFEKAKKDLAFFQGLLR